ncbi:C40 family peptidase [Nocardioides montaniterrae]
MPAMARMRALALSFLALIALTASLAVATTVAAPSAEALDRPVAARSALSIARHHLGAPYRYGSAGPHAFDCSGLVYFSFRHAGFRHIPRTSRAQAHFAHHIRRSHMRRGDLIFFTDGGGVYHVGIFVGRRHGHVRVLHAPYPGARVRVDRIWTNRWFAGSLR